jgi:AsmA protein
LCLKPIFDESSVLKKVSKILLKILKISGITVVAILALLFLAPFLFPDTVGKQIKHWTNQSIKGDLNFTKSRLSFFTHFPSLTLSLYDVDLKGSAPFLQDTLLSAERLGFGINLKKLIFDHLVSINKIYLTGAYIHVMVNDSGQANYNIYASDTSTHTVKKDSSAASLHLEKIIIKDSRLIYDDQSIPMLIQADHLYYEGTGDLNQSIFDLASHIKSDSLSFTLNNHAYVHRKALDANLVVSINTKTLALIFHENNIRMNQLKLAFTGKLNFLKNGYDMDFNLFSRDADLYQLVTILPPEYLDWLDKTTVKGTVSLSSSLKGKYIASTGEMPDFKVKLRISDGFIDYQKAEIPVSQLNGYAEVVVPSLDPESLHIKADSMSFRLANDYFRSRLESTGLSEPTIHLLADAQMNLQNLKLATGISTFDAKGQLDLHISANGKYAKKVVKVSLRKQDTVIASIPSFDISCNIKNGFVKYYKVAQPVSDIFLAMHATCPDANYHHAYFKIDTLHAAALKNYLEGNGIVHASIDYPMDLNLKGSVDLSDIKEVYPLDSLTLAGKMLFDIRADGKYAPDHHLFPKATAQFSLKDGLIQTRYYPHPVEKININLNASDNGGDLNSLNCSVQPASLQFEGKPFFFEGKFKNFDDLNYDLSVNGEIDLGKIYQVFARKDIGVSGFIRAKANFKGKQSDARNGRYDLLDNTGTMDVKDLTITHELFPKPFFIRQGHFRFDHDKMWFENFQANYGKSDLTLDGFVENAINYVLAKNDILHANFNLKSGNLDLNEFAVYASSKSASAQNNSSNPHSKSLSAENNSSDSKSSTAADQSAAGVIVIPTNLDLTVKADADKVLYNDIVLNQFTGGMNIRDGGIELSETSFEIIGCQASMSGKYASTSMTRANFEYKLVAKDFDVQRAYHEIKLFHDLASSAEHASGIISIDYSLSGKLNERLYPIYPSLAGGGVLSVKNVKFKNWKLFNTVSSSSGKSELKDPDLSKIEMKSTIKNNLITIEKFKFKTGGFRIRFEGQTSFDSKVNFKMRIGLPPLGIIGIPLRITGSSDNPKIKIGNSDTDPLEEKAE